MSGYEQLIKEAEENDNIVSMILVGSRGKGFENENSDYDVIMIVSDGVVDIFKNKYTKHSFENVDLMIHSLSEFKAYANWGGSSEEIWNRYDYAHCKILFDKTNSLSAVIQEKGYIPEEKLNEFIDYWIDGYVNGVYRSVKCISNNNMLGAHLEAANSIFDLLTLVFAFNGRHRPFLGYVKKELEKYPLQKLPWSSIEFVDKIKRVLASADLKTQQELLVGIEKMSRKTGHGHMFDSWEGKDTWTMTFKPENG